MQLPGPLTNTTGKVYFRQGGGSPSVGRGPAVTTLVAAGLGNLSEMQIPGPDSRPMESETL